MWGMFQQLGFQPGPGSQAVSSGICQLSHRMLPQEWEKLMGCREVMTFSRGKDVKPILILVEVKITGNWSCGYSAVPPFLRDAALRLQLLSQLWFPVGWA